MDTLNILDLFSGYGGWVKPWYKTVSYNISIDSVDIKKREHINYCMNVKEFESKKDYHLVYASPPCTYFSKMKNCQNRTTEHDIKDSILLADLSFYFANKAKYAYIIENPYTGLMPSIYSGFKKVDYSEYDYPMRKRTAIWSNLPLKLKTKKNISYNKYPLSYLSNEEKNKIPYKLASYVKWIFIRTYNKEIEKFRISR